MEGQKMAVKGTCLQSKVLCDMLCLISIVCVSRDWILWFRLHICSVSSLLKFLSCFSKFVSRMLLSISLLMIPTNELENKPSTVG